MDKNLTGNSDMHSRPEYACTLLLHFRIPRLGTLALPWRESGRTISSDGERACGRVECGGPKCSSPYPQVFQFRPSSIEQRVPFISLISFRAVKSGLPSLPPFFPFLIPGAFSVRQSLPLSVSPSPHSAAMPPRCDAPRHFELEIGVRRPEEFLSLVDRHFDIRISYSRWFALLSW